MYVYMVKIMISIKIEMVEIVEMNTVKNFLVDVYGVHRLRLNEYRENENGENSCPLV